MTVGTAGSVMVPWLTASTKTISWCFHKVNMCQKNLFFFFFAIFLVINLYSLTKKRVICSIILRTQFTMKLVDSH